MTSLAQQAHEARELARSVSLEDWLRANPDVWPELKRLRMWESTIARLEAK